MIGAPDSEHGRPDRVLWEFFIDGERIVVYDRPGSRAAQWVAWELERDEYGLRGMTFADGDVMIDIGAHIGLVSIFLAKRWPGLRILAFEPFPDNHRNCADALAVNSVGNVTLLPMGISADGRRLSMRANPWNSASATSLDAVGAAGEIVSLTLDEVFDRWAVERCRLLKIDCEGMEYEILRGTGVLDRVGRLVGEFHGSRALTARGCVPADLLAHCSRFFDDDHLAVQFNDLDVTAPT